ncbi:MAG TPA: RidA family protein [Sphingomonas sp.]|nr:RidA family protein [Sphingomonas sp.]
MTLHLASFTESESLLFVSGQLPFDAGGGISASDIGGQTRQVLANIAGVLQSAGLSLSDIVKTTVWLKNAADFVAFDSAYAESFGEHRPARSTVISDLVLPAALIEIEAIARRRFTSGE